MLYQDAKWCGRMLAEQEIMHSRFPSFRLIESSTGELRWRGVLEPVAGYTFVVSVRLPPHYPYREPQCHIEEPRIQAGAPHVYASSDGHICVHRRTWDPMTGTAASCIPLIAAWLTAYACWLETREEF